MSKCPYCSFNSYPITDLIDFEAWRYAYRFCLEKLAQQTRGRKVSSVYFGGGSPSLLPATFIGDVVDDVHRLWSVVDNCEISMEMNPGNVTESHAANIKAAGINRISLGVQSLRADGLAILGRKHSVEDSLRALNWCAKFFQNYSIDIIYAWPTHNLDQWKKELAEVFALGAPHMSFYQLTVDEESVFGDMYSRGELLIPDDDTCASMFEYLQDAAARAGLPAYEVSNHAIPGLECRHNISYWEYVDYIGIGPGAHGRLTIAPDSRNGIPSTSQTFLEAHDERAEPEQSRKQAVAKSQAPFLSTSTPQKCAIIQEPNPQKWLNSIMDNQHILEDITALSLEKQMKEALLVGLRMTKGIRCDGLPMPLDHIVNMKAFERLVKEKYLVNKDGVLAATFKGLRRLNALTSYLLNG